LPSPSETPIFPQAGQLQQRKDITMGDRSPKSVHKQATQKQAKANGAKQQRIQTLAAKQAGSLKKK
jgi:hypothetical protein